MLQESCYKKDTDWSDLGRHIPLLQDVLKEGYSCVKKVTSIQTICDAMNSKCFQRYATTVHQLLLPLHDSSNNICYTRKNIFCAKTRFQLHRSSMTERRLNNMSITSHSYGVNRLIRLNFNCKGIHWAA